MGLTYRGFVTAYLVHLRDDGYEEPRIQVPLGDQALDEGDQLCAGSCTLREDGQHPKRQ